jgi:1-pyrroline-5-carboxylate dehydrogenase
MALRNKEVEDFFVESVQRVMPKSDAQARGEVVVTRKMIENMSGDCPRFFLRGFNVAGDHQGQMSQGFRWPYGPVAIICPFNFPFEIPVLQLIGALMAGNKVLLKVDQKVAMVMEQMLRLMHDCGMPKEDLDMIQCGGEPMQNLITSSPIRNTQFTGSSIVANRLAEVTKGKVRLEDAGMDWKILGPDVVDKEFVAFTCDQDAYACGGQKCSAQSIMFAHENWMEAGIIDMIKEQAAKRSLSDLTISPVITWDNDKIQKHVDACLAIPGSKLLFGGKPLTGHKVPKCYGAYEPTAVYVPLEQINNDKYFDTVMTELFGPFQIITSYTSNELPIV